MRRCVVSIAVIESGEHSRVVFIRVCDTCDNAVRQQNQAIGINMSDSLRCVFWSLEIGRRSLVDAMLKPPRTSPNTEASRSGIKWCLSLSTRSRPTWQLCDHLVAIVEPHAPTVNATGVNAFEHLMRHGQPDTSDGHNLSADLMCWVGLVPNTAKGRPGSATASFPRAMRCWLLGIGHFSCQEASFSRSTVCSGLSLRLQHAHISRQACHCMH